MGGGFYSTSSRSVRASSEGYDTKSAHEIFTERNINSAMSPYGVALRESRDSNDHPNSVPIIIGLDVTGSMGSIPHHLVKEGLPTMVGKLIQNGIPDPQILFLALGDHECDRSPLQVGQFESSDELMDLWLTKTYLEGGGGGNDGESYLLAWYFASKHTSIDSFEKRGQKGFLFTIGDEPTLQSLPKNVMSKLMGEGQYDNFTSVQLLDEARKTYNVYHIHVAETHAGSRQRTIDGWKQLMGEDLLIAKHKEDVPTIISETILKHQKGASVLVDGKKTDNTIINETPTNIL